jgi:hypothetical protein
MKSMLMPKEVTPLEVLAMLPSLTNWPGPLGEEMVELFSMRKEPVSWFWMPGGCIPEPPVGSKTMVLASCQWTTPWLSRM